MIRIRVWRDLHKRVRVLTCRGHAEAGPDGQDVVCAAVSAAVQLALHGVVERLRLPAQFVQNSGRVTLSMPEYWKLKPEEAVSAAFLLDTVATWLRDLAARNPDFIRFDRGDRGTDEKHGPDT